MKQLHVGVLFGGKSSEHEISRKSVMLILAAIPEKHKKTAIGITKAGEWYVYLGDHALIESGEWEQSEQKYPISFTPKGMSYQKDGAQFALDIDVAFPVLHGKYGEDGTVQGLFEMLGIPYVGCGVGASANAMDKSITKLLVSTLGIRQARYVLVDRYNKNDLASVIAESEQMLGYPVFVKPCRFGSSVGVVKAKDREALSEGLTCALDYDERILIEEAIDARELECAVLSTDTETVVEVGEVISALEYYDYEAKYNNPTSKTEIYPQISPDIEQQLKRDAVRIFRTLDCRGLARVDFFLDRKTGELVFNEINTLPGFTPISMYPMLIGKHGISHEELVTRLIDDALKR